MEKLEQAQAEKLKRSDAFDREKQAKDLAGYKAVGDGYRAQLSAMRPQERASQAFLVGDDLVPQGTPDAYTYGRKNPAFYRARGSPVGARAILVSMPGGYRSCGPSRNSSISSSTWPRSRRW
ncbi:MAG: hypothetical protein IT184_07430 [Acidobacteria bacterium]|nr:hypothetical protein [Acidobacteriota bacterium]